MAFSPLYGSEATLNRVQSNIGPLQKAIKDIQAALEPVACLVSSNASQTIQPSVYTQVVFEKTELDTHGAVLWTSSSWAWTCPKAGLYSVQGAIHLLPLNAGKTTVLSLGVAPPNSDYSNRRGSRVGTVASQMSGLTVSVVLSLSKGQSLSLFVYHDDSVARQIEALNQSCFLSIARIPSL